MVTGMQSGHTDIEVLQFLLFLVQSPYGHCIAHLLNCLALPTTTSLLILWNPFQGE